MLSILSFEMKRPLSHEDKWKWSMFDYFRKTNLSGLILLCIVFRQRWSQQKMWLTPSWQLLFISKSYLYFRVVSSLIVPGRSAASAGLGKWEVPNFANYWTSTVVIVLLFLLAPTVELNKFCIWDRMRSSTLLVTELQVTGGNFWSNSDSFAFDP